jgi:hypothetical protein
MIYGSERLIRAFVAAGVQLTEEHVKATEAAP